MPDLVKLVGLFDSDDIFIKKIKYSSPSAVEEGAILFSNELGAVTIILHGFEGIKKLFIHMNGIKNMSFNFEYELNFSAIYNEFDNTFSIAFDNLSSPILCKQLSFKVIE